MSLQKTPISILQELMARKYLPLPVYDIETTSDMPSPNRFVCTVVCAGIKAVGKGSTKKDAKHNSAKNALSILGYKNEPQIRVGDYIDGKLFSQKEENRHETTNKPMFFPQKTTFVNYVGKLNEFMINKRFCSQPTYEFDVDFSTGGFLATCKVSDMSVIGLGLNKKDAKQNAAQLMLEELSKNGFASELALKEYEESEAFADNTKRVIEKFKELSLLQNSFVPKKECKDLLPTIPFNSNTVLKEEPEEDQTLAELEEYLEEHKFYYTSHVLQKNPLVVVIISKDTIITLLGSGRTKESALCDALKQAVLIVKHGCSLTFDPDC